MAEPKTYFILRNTDYKPDGLIQLGQLISDPRTPYRCIAPPLKPLPADLIHHAYKKDWSLEKSKGAAGEVGVFAHFLTAFTAETSAKASRDFSNSWKAATLETSFLELGEDVESPYVKASVKEAAVQKWLKRDKFLKKVIYMVTGIRVARQPGETSYGMSKGKGGSAKFGADPGTGGLVSAGVQGSLERTRGITETSTPPDDFVFAYRLRKIHISLFNKVTLGKDLSGAELHRGDYVGDESDDSDEDELGKVPVVVGDIEELLVEKNDFGSSLPARHEKKSGVDEIDGRRCLVILSD
ncbi:hypothetical protein CkaCkLH20_03398 [Colletotrichum karsti]|uniref:Uncharacterized protein n=1 Tax=Colletotrichum karsti TaxID=1095194 RepID=A0A9P6LN56_9PEZI|nr:uncharacterized protein CkaCkLH20_03398 [Colletotrichum karsti]KAF9879165.1 hypothetical protein CkaCkLH20_03398 [Colletotrichum karsti]